MHLDEWGGGPRIVQGQNEAMKILPEEADLASTFQQQLKEENPKHAKNKAFEEVAEQANISHSNESQLEETFKVTSQEEKRIGCLWACRTSCRKIMIFPGISVQYKTIETIRGRKGKLRKKGRVTWPERGPKLKMRSKR